MSGPILGIGVDLVAIDRIERAMKNPRFIERVLTMREREREITPQYVAGRWAAKEAVAKSLRRSLSWHDVEILGEKAPECVLAPHLSGEGYVHVSITHESTHAVGMAVLVSLG